MRAGDAAGQWPVVSTGPLQNDPVAHPLGQVASFLVSLEDIDLAARYSLADRVLPRRLVLDAGCGDGRGAALLARPGRTVVALDRRPSPFVPPGIDFRQGDLSTLQAPERAFAGIACLDVLDETDEPGALLADLCRLLASDGVLVVSVRHRVRGGAASLAPTAVETHLRSAFAYVRCISASVVAEWRFGIEPPLTSTPHSDGGQEHPHWQAPGRRFFVASATALPPFGWLAIPGLPLDLGALREDHEHAVELVRRLHVELATAHEDIQQGEDLRTRLVEAEQEVSTIPDLRAMLRTLRTERDDMHELLRSYLRSRPYPQLAMALEALHGAGIEVGEDVREALHVLLTELDRRPDLQTWLVVDDHVKIADLVAWALGAAAHDRSRPLLARHLSALSWLARRMPLDRTIIARIA
jgi:SAM-dependent methyltransferase